MIIEHLHKCPNSFILIFKNYYIYTAPAFCYFINHTNSVTQVAFSWRSGVCCFDVSWICCCGCSCDLSMPRCCDCMTCNSCSNPCQNCGIPACQCFPCFSSKCFKKWKCSLKCRSSSCCCMPKHSCCPTCSCTRSTCYPKCPNLNLCSCCHKSCCFPCYYCM